MSHLYWHRGIREGEAGDKDRVAAIASQAFRLSRFHADPLIVDTVADRVKEEWATNFFRGSRGDRLLVAEKEGVVLGFNLLIRSGETASIDLMAVAPEGRRQGLGTGLVRAIKGVFPDCRAVEVTTELRNAAAMNCYLGNGFSYVDADYAFHWHGPA